MLLNNKTKHLHSFIYHFWYSILPNKNSPNKKLNTLEVFYSIFIHTIMPNSSVVFNMSHLWNLISYFTPIPFFITFSSYTPPINPPNPLHHRPYYIYPPSFFLYLPSTLPQSHGMYKWPTGTRERSTRISQKSTLVRKIVLYMYDNDDRWFICSY